MLAEAFTPANEKKSVPVTITLFKEVTLERFIGKYVALALNYDEGLFEMRYLDCLI